MVFPGTTICRVMASFHNFMFFIYCSIYCIFILFFLLSKKVVGPWPPAHPPIDAAPGYSIFCFPAVVLNILLLYQCASKTLWHLSMVRAHLQQDCKATTRREFSFNYPGPRRSSYSLDRLRNDERLGRSSTSRLVIQCLNVVTFYY